MLTLLEQHHCDSVNMASGKQLANTAQSEARTSVKTGTLGVAAVSFCIYQLPTPLTFLALHKKDC